MEQGITKNHQRLIIILILVASCLALVSVFRASISAGAAEPLVTSGSLNLSLELYVSGTEGLVQPVSLANAGPGDDRLFVVERAGIIKVVADGGDVLGTPFLNITGRVDDSASEEGLLGLVFHPDYANNGYFYVNYINTTGGTRRTRISQFQVSTDPNIADPSSEEILLTVTQPEWNHNAGDIHFGPDGYLYIPLGDGEVLVIQTTMARGGILSSEMSPGLMSFSPWHIAGLFRHWYRNYTIPDSNPFIDGNGNRCDEIWAFGLRNPWRSSFDRVTGDFYMGDVGQDTWEEVNFQPAASTGGENYGWRCYEGNHTFNSSGCGPSTTYDFPVFEYSQSGNGCTVIGGYVYRGNQYPEMYGRYFLADYCNGYIWDLIPGGWDSTRHSNMTRFGYASFGEGSDGELYLANESNGRVYHLVEDTLATPTPTPSPTATATCVPTPTPQPTATPGGPTLDSETYLPALLKQNVSYCW